MALNTTIRRGIDEALAMLAERKAGALAVLEERWPRFRQWAGEVGKSIAPPRYRPGDAATIVADPRFERLVERLYQRGPRLIAELLAEVGARHGIRGDIDAAIEKFLNIPDEVLDATGGRDLPPLPIHEVRK